MNDYEIWYAISNLSYRVKNKLIKHFQSIQNIWYYSMKDEKNDFMPKETKETLRKAWDKYKISFIKEKLIDEDINTVVITDELYPKRLREYDDSPYMLFYKGDIEGLNNEHSVAIIGSRNCTNYGINVTRIIAEHMCKSSVNVISGMARGIDTIGHRKCVDNDSYTCAVLGSGIDVVYPKENKNLFNKIINNGCILSQFIPGTKPYAYNFPTRNRIISALSDIIVVIEASEKSGSLITAGAALDQGKDVMAVPGDIFSSQSKGTNKLIKDGAYNFTCIDDIYELLRINKLDLHIKNNKELHPLEKLIYSNLKTSPIHFDEILRLTNIDIKQLYEVLFELQLKDEIICLSGNYYARNNKEI